MRPIAMELLRLVWQAVILYVVVLFVVRLLGKRSVGKLAPFDLAVIIR
ncbi:MAG: hypothetical protein H5U04_10050, partial [Firmicutes bacterium]|nr:hypothetical protein [Bacillota bacterium]